MPIVVVGGGSEVVVGAGVVVTGTVTITGTFSETKSIENFNENAKKPPQAGCVWEIAIRHGRRREEKAGRV